MTRGPRDGAVLPAYLCLVSRQESSFLVKRGETIGISNGGSSTWEELHSLLQREVTILPKSMEKVLGLVKF